MLTKVALRVVCVYCAFVQCVFVFVSVCALCVCVCVFVQCAFRRLLFLNVYAVGLRKLLKSISAI